MEWAHTRFDCQVLWVEPYPIRLPRLSDAKRLLHRFKADKKQLQALAWKNAPWLQVLQPPSLPLEPLPGGAAVCSWIQHSLRQHLQELLEDAQTWLTIGRPSGMALTLCQKQQGNRVLYDVMDDMAQFNRGISREWVEHTHQQLTQQVETVWGSSQRIVQKLSAATRHPPILVRNGVNLSMVSSLEQRTTSTAKPLLRYQQSLIIGYVGTLAAWFDWAILIRLAKALPKAQFHIYGPLEGIHPPDLPSNVELRGPIAHESISGLMRTWHAGLIPFLKNELTQSVDPVKYYEYRARYS